VLKLIVHADDFGISEDVNEGILKAHRNGVLTSTSIMANGRAFKDAIRKAKSNPSLDVGIHLTLVEEQPLSSVDVIPGLVSPEGNFHPNAADFTRRYLMGYVPVYQIRSELEKQIRRVLDTGIRISHLDSHQHLHMLPSILTTIIVLARKYKIPAIRIPSERLRFYMLKDLVRIPRLIQMGILNLFCLGKRRRVPNCTQNFVGFYYGGDLSTNNFYKLIDSLPSNGTCELMCHPGSQNSSQQYPHWNYHHFEELEALTNDKIANLLEDEGVLLVSYRDI